MREVISCLKEYLDQGLPCATATIVQVMGSIPNSVGAKMLVGPQGVVLAGTIGGGAFEHAALQEAAKAIASGQSRLFSWSLTEKAAGGLGMLCGGTAKVFLEVFLPAAQLIMLGGGHVNICLWRLARDLGYCGIVIDDREQWANSRNFPDCQLVPLSDPVCAFKEIAWVENSYIVIGTPDQDTAALRAVVIQELPCRYIGMIASKRKTLLIARALEQEGIDLSGVLERLHAPIGLDLGRVKSPEAVALSIMAEIQAIRYGGSGQPLGVAGQRQELLAGRRAGVD